MSREKTIIPPFRVAAADCLLLVFAFFAANLLHRGTLFLPEGYFFLLGIFYLCWLAASVTGDKFKAASYKGFWETILLFVKTGLYLVYVISFAIVFFGLHTYSRIHVYSTCVLFLFLEFGFFAVYCRYSDVCQFESIGAWRERRRRSARDKQRSASLMFYDLVLVFAAFFAVNYIKRGHLTLLPAYDMLLLIILALWFAVSLATNKFRISRQMDFYFHLWQWLKAGLIMLAIVSMLVFGLRLFHFSRFQGFGTIVLLMLLEAGLLAVFFKRRKGAAEEEDIESLDKVRDVLGQEHLSMDVDIEALRQKLMEPARVEVGAILLKNYLPDLFDFIDKNVNLNDILRVETTVENTTAPLLVSYERGLFYRLFINLHKLNDIRNINKYFLNVHQVLLPGGCFVVKAHTIRTHRDWMFDKYPRRIAAVFYALDFCFNRVLPKLPWVKKGYFAVTRGKNRILSKAEIMGRLCFCGFEIVAEKEMNKRFFVIARKAKTPSLDESPTYGPLVTLKRSGRGGEVLGIYKFRTMHPYSEYLQAYAYERQGLKSGGKIEDDFRMTTWGKFMRKLWLDELPMLYNWLKGDLGIVGVRPLSFHYLSLYDRELQELRKRVKPGLIPPFYADLPGTFEEICDSERRYIERFLEKPIKTQVTYFYNALVNILFKGARSG